jgi:ketosteroid isomerase-like protein
MLRSAAYFATPEEASAAFYDAFAKADAEAMMFAWADDEDIVCVHPGAMPLVGYAAVRSAWQSVFTNSPAMRVELQHEQWHTSATMATQTVVEWIRFAQDVQPRGGVAATNTFIRTINGWRVLAHHGSPISAPQASAQGAVLH